MPACPMTMSQPFHSQQGQGKAQLTGSSTGAHSKYRQGQGANAERGALSSSCAIVPMPWNSSTKRQRGQRQCRQSLVCAPAAGPLLPTFSVAPLSLSVVLWCLSVSLSLCMPALPCLPACPARCCPRARAAEERPVQCCVTLQA